MKQLNICRLQFEFNFPKHRLSQFRGAICELLGRDKELFHNHDNQDSGKKYHFEYPKIQYSIHNGRPCIVGYKEGMEMIYTDLLPRIRINRYLQIGGDQFPLQNFTIVESSFDIKLNTVPSIFQLTNWIALNRDNFKLWNSYNGEHFQQMLLLNSALNGHLKSAYRSIAPDLPQELINAQVLKIDNVQKMTWRKIPLLSFNVDIESNVPLHPFLSIGRMSAFGFGNSHEIIFNEPLIT